MKEISRKFEIRNITTAVTLLRLRIGIIRPKWIYIRCRVSAISQTRRAFEMKCSQVNLIVYNYRGLKQSNGSKNNMRYTLPLSLTYWSHEKIVNKFCIFDRFRTPFLYSSLKANCVLLISQTLQSDQSCSQPLVEIERVHGVKILVKSSWG